MARFATTSSRLVVLAVLLMASPHSGPAEARYRGSDTTCVTGTSDGEKLSVWSRPSSNSERVGRLASDACGMNVEAVGGDWTYIRGTDHKGQNIEGWVDNRYLRPAASAHSDEAGIDDSSSSGFPIEAASGGGVVRAGPGIDYRKVASTGQFEPITVVRNTDVMMNGYPWFEIRFSGGRKGYQWGGIICSTDEPFVGTFDKCENFRRSLNRNSGTAKKYNNKERPRNGCGSGKIRLEGKCIRRSQAASFCGPGYRIVGNKCVHQNQLRNRGQGCPRGQVWSAQEGCHYDD